MDGMGGIQWNSSLRRITPLELTVTQTEIGEGRFGVVYEGYLVADTPGGNIIKVACKSLKGRPIKHPLTYTNIGPNDNERIE